MTDIAEVQSEIKAVEFALVSFADYENDQERKNFLRQNFTAIPGLKTYFSFSETELKDEMKQLLDLLLVGLQQAVAPQEIVPTVARSGILECISRMTEVKVQVSGEEYTILKCDDNFKLSVRVSKEFPDFVLIRQCTLNVIALIQDRIESVGRFLITGTPGVGKTVSVIVWLYLALKGELEMSFKHIIADLKSGCILLSQNATGIWVEQLYPRDYFMTHRIEETNEVLYLYDATYNKLPFLLPYCSVVFSSPILLHFKEFIKIDSVLRMIYFTPMWQWDEIEALHKISTTLQNRASLPDIRRLFEIWGGLPRQIFTPYQIGYAALTDAIGNCNAVACIQVLEKGSFLSYGERDSNEMLMQFDVADDDTYEHAIVNFGSPFIRYKLVEGATGSRDSCGRCA